MQNRIITGLIVLLGFAGTIVAQSTPDVIEVPFTFTQLQIILKADINDKGPFNMFLDTGCSESFIDRSVAKDLGLKVSTKGSQVRGPEVLNTKAFSTTLERLQVGPIETRNVGAFVQEEKQGIPGIHVDGCLGYTFLKHWVVQIDYPGRVVRFLSAAPERRTDDVTFHLHDMNLIDDVRVNDVAFTAGIDTGQDFPFTILPKAVQTLHLHGESGFNIAIAKSLAIGPIIVDKPGVLLAQKGDGWDKFSFGVNIGNNFFKDYVLTMDYPRETVVLRRSAGQQKDQ